MEPKKQTVNPEEQVKLDADCLEAIGQALKKLRSAKPEERNELSRRYAVTITELEKAYAYFYTWVSVEVGGNIR